MKNTVELANRKVVNFFKKVHPLDHTLARQKAARWFRTRNSVFNGKTPMDMIAQGRLDEVMKLIDSVVKST
jgi:hypothetical protein